MYDDNVLEEDLNNEDVLSDDSMFDDKKKTSLIENEEDGVEFESFDDSKPDW